MTGTIAPTSRGWYEFLRRRELDEVNFWKPSGRRAFRAEPFSPFLFKLKRPHNAICGFGFFAKWARLPDWLARAYVGAGNGCESFPAMKECIARLRLDYQNGRTYCSFDGRQVALPSAAEERPSADFLLWHNRNVCRG